jgi:hypothetical protein
VHFSVRDGLVLFDWCLLAGDYELLVPLKAECLLDDQQ